MKLTPLGVLSLGHALITIYFWPPEVAAVVNHTIDDQFGDSLTGLQPIYFPAENAWSHWSGQACGSECDGTVNPLATRAFDGTYTVATRYPDLAPMGVSMQFTGTAIYVFFILANRLVMGILGDANTPTANFTIDGKTPVPLTYTPGPLTGLFQYNALVFSQTDLSNTLHTLNITVGSVDVYLNFDYAIYTHDDIVSASPSLPSTTIPTSHGSLTSDTVSATSSLRSAMTSTSQKSSTSDAVPYSTAASTASTPAVTGARTPVGAIVAGIAGGIVTFVLVGFLLLCWRRRGGHDALQPLITKFDLGESPSAASAPEMTYAHPPVRSKVSIATPHMANQTGQNSGYSARGGAGPSRQNKLRTLLGNPNSTAAIASGGRPQRGYEGRISHPNTQESTREEIRRERQGELDNRLRTLQQEMEQVTEGLQVLRRERTLGASEGEVGLSVSDMRAEIRLMSEQIQLLREQQSSAWAQGLSDDPPPGYVPMETRTRNSREEPS